MSDERPGWHRHPNGGGWVQDTATVAPTAYVGRSARVYGSAQVSDSARVYGSAQVSGSARVCGSARVSHARNMLTVGPVGSEHRTVTAFRTDDGHEVRAGCWSGTVEELAERIADPAVAWPDADDADRLRWQRDYEAVVALVRVRVAEWSAEREGVVE